MLPEGLAAERARELLYHLVLTRALDERMWQLNRQGKASFILTGRGHEATQIGSAAVVRPGVDWVYTYYRSLAVGVTLGVSARDIMLSVLARRDDPFAGGRQLPLHFSVPALRLVSRSSVVATQIPHAAGTALASRLRGEDAVTICYFGEGATSEGDFHEGLNFAGVHRLPVVFVCENNRYAISVPQHRQMAVDDVADRAAGYGMPGVVVDGQDLFAVFAATRQAFERARRGEGPTLLEAKTYRIVPHSSDDDDRTYRSREEVAAWSARDPLVLYQRTLEDLGLVTPADLAAWREQAQADVDDATAFAEAAPPPDPRDALRHIFASE
ncbi:MAG: thiamine pyrophosphate-dependent dehydrogenase E1 component subunit alpha [Chloroflexi bacterium]|nr:thiamine pyrophosphate-dependent dehydrogenase E1 component subunit alpha [Chloroflexota bacterium]MBI4507286.1 thiamine pyrophosphate-dependent dehydrogenase E1 component subunit alpha [Chloroflexota bacterium]